MTFTYNADVSTDRDRVRLLVSDTEEQDSQSNTIYVFEDAEVDAMLGLAGGVFGAAALLLRSLVADKAKMMAIRMGVAQGGVTITNEKAMASLASMASRMEERESQDITPQIVDWRSESADLARSLNESDLYDRDHVSTGGEFG